MAGSPPNFHKMDARSACIQGVLKVKVKVKGHVIRALSWILGMSYSVIYGLVSLSKRRASTRPLSTLLGVTETQEPPSMWFSKFFTVGMPRNYGRRCRHPDIGLGGMYPLPPQKKKRENIFRAIIM